MSIDLLCYALQTWVGMTCLAILLKLRKLDKSLAELFWKREALLAKTLEQLEESTKGEKKKELI